MIVALLGPSADLERCEAARDALVAAGITVAFDWPSQVRAMRDRGLTDADLTVWQRREIAIACTSGIDRSDLAWWLSSGGVGASYEAGWAERAGVEVVVSGEPHPIYQGDVQFPSDFAALAWIVGGR